MGFQLGGWKTAVGIAVIEASFGIGMAVSDGLPIWLRIVAPFMFGVGFIVAVRAALALYKKT